MAALTIALAAALTIALAAALTIALAAAAPAPASAFQLTGSVVGPGGFPVDEVDLDVEDVATGLALVFPEDNTDSDGRFALEVPPGVYRIFFEPPAGLPLAPQVVPRLEIAGDTVLTVTLRRGIGLAGRVTGPEGAGVAEVDLDIWDRALRVKMPAPGATDRTNALGFYSLLVPPGTYDILANPPLATRLASVRIDSVAVGEEDVIVNVRLATGFVLSGTVDGAGARPAAGIDIDMTDLDSGADVPLAEDKTDAEGRFALVLPKGRYELLLDAPPATRLVSAVIDGLVIDSDRTLALALAPGFLIEGRVRDPGGQLVEGANLDFVDAASGHVAPTPSDFSNVQGAYAVVLPAGTYDLVAFPPPAASYPPDTTRAIAVAGDRRLDVFFGPDPAPPAAPVLRPIYPNPTPGGAWIPFQLPESPGPTRIVIADAAGRVVRLLEPPAPTSGVGPSGLPGEGVMRWDGRDRRGLIAPSGVYFVRLEAGGAAASRKLVVFRESLR